MMLSQLTRDGDLFSIVTFEMEIPLLSIYILIAAPVR
jgi:hypothetical protein